MARKIAGWLFVLCGLLASAGSARADGIITLQAFHATGQPVTGPVAPGTDVVVDILLSADAEDAPVADVRMIQFDFDATGSGIQLVSYTWTVDKNAYFSVPAPDFPIANVVTAFTTSGPGLIILTTTPVKVGSVDITIDGAGRLDLVNPENTDPNYGADIYAGFGLSDPAEHFTFMAGNLQGGSLVFSVSGADGGSGGDTGGGAPGGTPQPNDQDGDGVIDTLDAFPTNPDEAIDTNSDGVGNNADPDDDSDGVVDEQDAFPIDPVETTDSDGDGVGDNEDTDRDGDSVANDGDAFPDDPTEAMDTDDDGIGNNADTDDDDDGVEDADDAFPLDFNRSGDANGNGIDDNDEEATSTPGSQPRMCGAGMLGSSMLLLMSLGMMSYRPRRLY